MSDIKKLDVIDALPQYYLPYAQYVNQTRSLPDARDGLKQGARFILYAQYLNKLTHDKKPRKAVATVSASMEFSVHGDSSILGTAVRMSQPFSLRYPLITVKGNNGSQVYGSDVYSQARYLEMYSGKLASEMVNLLDKETIKEWEMNYTQDKEYPVVLPSLFPNFVNGVTGIGVAVSTSIPQFNLRQVCASAIKLLDNSEVDFNEIYCPVDFCTGGILINEDEVKISLARGQGKSALIRAKVEYDSKNRELVVTELPYQVTSSGVVTQIQKCIDDSKINGIEAVFDGSDIDGVRICIKLVKSALPEKILRELYKETSLQHHYGINMMMLQDGKIPRLYTFKTMLESYLAHARTVLYRAYEYDLRKAKDRLEILNGYLIALANITEVVETIKNSKTKDEASHELMERFGFTSNQVKAVLELKLQRLVNLEAIKIEEEKNKLDKEVKYLEFILSDDNEFKNKLKEEIQRIATEYGDNRRTEILSLKIKEDEIIEEKNLIVYFTNYNNVYTEESNTLLAQGRGGRGSKVKLSKGEVILKTIGGKSNSNLLIFTNKGRAYSVSFEKLLDHNNLEVLLELQEGEKIVQVASNESTEHIVFITKNGLIKKSKKELYNITAKGVIAIKLLDDDDIVKILFVDEEPIALLTQQGLFKIIESKPVTATGRVSQGVIAAKLDANDFIVDAQVVTLSDTEIVSVTDKGFCARVLLSDFTVTGRHAKGKSLQKGILKGFILIPSHHKEISVVSSQNIITIPTSSIIITGRSVIGVKVINLKSEEIINIVKKI